MFSHNWKVNLATRKMVVFQQRLRKEGFEKGGGKINPLYTIETS